MNAAAEFGTAAGVMLVLAIAGGGKAMAGQSDEVSARSITLVGTVLGLGVECLRFETQDGRTVSLERFGRRKAMAGDRLRLTGHWAQVSRCMEGPAFVVMDFERLKGE